MGLLNVRSFPNMNNQAFENTQDFQESSDLPSSIILLIPRGDLPLMYRGISIVGNCVITLFRTSLEPMHMLGIQKYK